MPTTRSGASKVNRDLYTGRIIPAHHKWIDAKTGDVYNARSLHKDFELRSGVTVRNGTTPHALVLPYTRRQVTRRERVEIHLKALPLARQTNPKTIGEILADIENTKLRREMALLYLKKLPTLQAKQRLLIQLKNSKNFGKLLGKSFTTPAEKRTMLASKPISTKVASFHRISLSRRMLESIILFSVKNEGLTRTQTQARVKEIMERLRHATDVQRQVDELLRRSEEAAP